MNKFNFFHCH